MRAIAEYLVVDRKQTRGGEDDGHQQKNTHSFEHLVAVEEECAEKIFN